MKRRPIYGWLGAAAIFLFLGAAAQENESLKKEIRTDKAPQAIGPYSQGIAAGGFVFCSGQIPIDPATGKIVEGGIEEQTRRVIKNLAAVLEAAGSSLDRVVKCTVMIADLNDFAAMNKIYAEYFKTPAPARATFEVSSLAMNARIEIDCIAVKR
jgi:2-iminobutanoate/2-iminopropanoate deaminase